MRSSWSLEKYYLFVLVLLNDIFEIMCGELIFLDAFIKNSTNIVLVFCFFYKTETQNHASQMWFFRLTFHLRTATVPQRDREPRERSSWPPARPDWGQTGRAASRGQKSPTQLRRFSPTEQACMKRVTQTGRRHLWAQEVQIYHK